MPIRAGRAIGGDGGRNRGRAAQDLIPLRESSRKRRHRFAQGHAGAALARRRY
jgi:hypothetical protein